MISGPQFDTIFSSFANSLKTYHNIDMTYQYSYQDHSYYIRMSKDNYSIQTRLSVDIIKQSKNPCDVIDMTLLEMARKVIEVTSKTKTIVSPKGWLKEEFDMTDIEKPFTEEETNRIVRAKEIIKQIFQSRIHLHSTDRIVIAGGAFSSIFHNEKPRDYDIFLLKGSKGYEFSTDDDRFKFSDVRYMNNDKITKVVLDTETNFQYIFTEFDTREELINHFDMVHCCVSYVPDEDKMYISPLVYNTIMKRVVKPNGNKTIADWRYDKMIKRGWKNAA